MKALSENWTYVRSTGRWYYHKRDERKSLIVGDDGTMRYPRYWYAVFSHGVEIA